MLRSARSCVCVWGVLSVPLCIEHCPHGKMFQSKARQPQLSLKVSELGEVPFTKRRHLQLVRRVRRKIPDLAYLTCTFQSHEPPGGPKFFSPKLVHRGRQTWRRRRWATA